MKSSPTPDITSKKQFRTELIELCKRHGVSIGEIEYRDNDENYTGSNFYFQGDNIDSVELSDLMGELNPPVKKWRITGDAPHLPTDKPKGTALRA